LSYADLSYANLRDTNLRNANLTDVHFCNTIMPDGRVRNDNSD